MALFDGSSFDNPKPQKPLAAGSQKISLHINKGENNLSATEFNRKLNFALEVLKFFPDWENQIYAGEKSDEAINIAKEQYAPAKKDENGNIIAPSFGEVMRSKTYGQFNGTNLGGYTNDIEFYDYAGDFDHIKDKIDNEPEQPVEELIDPALWEKVQTAMKSENRSYYEIIMDGIEDKTPEEAFNLLVAMLESRTRIVSTMNEVFGAPDQTDAEKIEQFNQFLSQFKDQINNKKLGLLEFLLNTQQSFFSRVFPLFGETDEFYESDLDKQRAGEFFDELSAKISQYIGLDDLEKLTDEQIASLPKEKQDAVLIWDKWLNPEDVIAPAQNINPKDTEWGKADYEKTGEFINELTQENIVGRIGERRDLKIYKQKMEEWQDKKEEEEQEELNQLKRANKNQQEQKALQAKQRRTKIGEAIVNRQTTKINPNSGNKKTTRVNYAQVVSRIAGRIKEARGKTATSVLANITPGKTIRYAKAPTAAVPKAGTENNVSVAKASAKKSSEAVKAVKPVARRSSALKAAKSSKPTRLASTTPEARTAMSRAYTQANIKAKAPKQNKD